MRIKEGDYVRIVEREVAPADAKTGLFYPYFAGLAGTVDRVYNKEVCVSVDLETLPEDVLKRHNGIQDSMRRKWLNGLSNEVRNKLAPEDKKFELAYKILVHSTDLQKVKKGEPTPVAIKSVKPVAQEAVVEKRAAKKPVAEKTTAVKPTARTAAKASKAEKAPARAAKGSRTAAKPSTRVSKASPSRQAAAKARTAPPSKPAKSAKSRAPRKADVGAKGTELVTSADLDAAEKAFLRARQKALKAKKE